MEKSFFKTTLSWGFLLWLFGYVLGIILFFFVPKSLIGWIITPFGILFTLWVLLKKINFKFFKSYIFLGFFWTLIALFLDYFLLVKLLKPTDGYYKTDVYLYYISTFILPMVVGLLKKKQ